MRIPKQGSPLVNIPQGQKGGRRYRGDLQIPSQQGWGDASAFGGQQNWKPITDGFKDITEAAQKIGFEVAEKRAQTRALNAYANFSKDVDGYLYGDDGIMLHEGERAIGITTETSGFLDKSIASYTRNMSEREAEIFKRQATSQRLSLMGSVSKHEGIQLEAANTQAYKSAISSMMESSLLARGDDRAYDQTAAEVERMGQEMMHKKGFDQQSIDFMTGQTRSLMNANRIIALAQDGNFDKAFALLDSGELNEADRLKARAGLAEGFSRSVTGKVLAGDTSGARKDLEKAYFGNAAADVAQYESGAQGSLAIGYDKNGGTSYGLYQISSKAGTYDGWLKWLDENGHADVAAKLREAGPADTGSRDGKAPQVWRDLAANGEITAEMQTRFITQNLVNPALEKLPDAARQAVQSDPVLYRVMFSTAVQHGAPEAARMFAANWEKTDGDKEAFLDSLYADRKTRFTSSETQVQASVASRLDRERQDLRQGQGGILDQSQYLALDNAVRAGEADDLVQDYVARLDADGDVEAIRKEILSLPEIERRKVKPLFESHYKNWRVGQELKKQDSIIDNRSQMSGMSLSEAYRYVESMPENTWQERDVKKQARQDYNEVTKHAGISGTTDPDAYLAIVEAINFPDEPGGIKTEKDLLAHEAAVKVSAKDMDKLRKDLAGASVIKDTEMTGAYLWVIGKRDKGALSKKEKNDLLSFTKWANEQAQKTSRANDPGYVKELADQWVVEGRWGTTFGEALKDKNDDWLPVLGDKDNERIATLFVLYPEIAEEWLGKAEHDMESAKRAYRKYEDEIRRGPRRRHDPLAYAPEVRVQSQKFHP